MAPKKILTKTQEAFLKIFQEKKILYSNFVLSGGTALAGFYLFHRYSEDLDFFSMKEVDPQGIFSLLRNFIKPLGFKKLEFEQSFNRNLYFFTGSKETLKTEFTYFPFDPLVKPKTHGKLKIDSLKDIAVNKVFTIYQKPRMRDFIDLFAILKAESSWTLQSLLKLARIKFDTNIDSIQWGSRLMQVQTLVDYPWLVARLDIKKIRAFFTKEALVEKKNIFE